jgi:hypothetical protein
MRLFINKLLFVFALIFVPIVSFAEDPPMNGWQFGQITTLNGRRFWPGQYGESFLEQDGYAIVSSRKIHYWLYDSYTYRNGQTDEIYNRIIPSWVEKMGYVIDFDNIRKYNPNPSLASSVKALMTQRSCDICVALITDNPNYDYVVINEYSKSKGIYWTTVYPLYK